jgi:hypothetical protein
LLEYCPQRNIPNPIRRQLRQETNFGCAICGTPIIEIHHIIPWSETRTHKQEEMIALCPTHHHRADCHEYSRKYLHNIKQNPHNRNVVADQFTIQSEDVCVTLGGSTVTNLSRILSVDNFDIISLTKEENYPLLNLNLFDEFDNWVAVVEGNQWFVDRRRVWDIEYIPKHLVLRYAPRKIALDVEISEGEIIIKGNLFFNGFNIQATDDDLLLNGKSQMVMHHVAVTNPPPLNTALNSPLAFSIGTGKPPFSRFPRHSFF